MLTIDVNRYEYEPAAGRLLISWRAPSGLDLGLTRDRLEVRFSPALEQITDVEVFDIFCACLLAHLGLRDSSVLIRGLPEVDAARLDFWRWFLNELDVDATVSFELGDSVSTAPASGPNPTKERVAAPHRVGLYFGGGVESLALLRQIKHTNPYLMTLDGPAWMNSDYDRSSIKGTLQSGLAERYKLEFLRVWTDARTLHSYGDEYVNRYVSGPLFFYALLPLMRRKSIGVCYLAAELESALPELPHDMSINPQFSYKVSKAPDPPLLSPLNAIPKLRLLEDLYRNDPELCSFLYSCLRNAETRWCGECGKCRRISAFCEAIGIPYAAIGMQEGISHNPESGSVITARYWHSIQKYLERKQGIPTQPDCPPVATTRRAFWRFPRLRRSA